MATNPPGFSFTILLMQNAPQSAKKGFSADWLVRGVLTKIGDIFDRLTGRGYKPTSTLATSELIERMKFLLDSEALDEDGRKFVPHNIKLKMQWDKFSTDSEDSLRALENEFLTAAVDHVNDKRYYTKAPFHVEAKPDYFTQGVKLFVSFDKFTDDETDAAISVAVPGTTNEAILASAPASEPIARSIRVRYSVGGNPLEKQLKTKEGMRLSVGRTKENHLAIDDPSLSKFHASLHLDREGKLQVADIGSTNGTFVNGERIAYGKAATVTARDKVRFGLVEATFELSALEAVTETVQEILKTESFAGGEFEFKTRSETILPATAPAVAVGKLDENRLPPTAPSIDISEAIAEQPLLTEQEIDTKKS